MLKRIRNLWRISAIELPQVATTKTLQTRLKETILGKKQATIVEDDPIDMFPDHDTTEQPHTD